MWHGAELEEFYLPIARNVDFKVPAHKQENTSVRLLQMRAYSVSLFRAHKHTHTHTHTHNQLNKHTHVFTAHTHMCVTPIRTFSHMHNHLVTYNLARRAGVKN